MKKQKDPERCAFCGHVEHRHAGELVPGGLALASGNRPCDCGHCENFIAAHPRAAVRGVR